MSAIVSFPRLSILEQVEFVFDTGSGRTVIAPADGKRLKIDYTRLAARKTGQGAGGRVSFFLEDGILTFIDRMDGGNALISYPIQVGILIPHANKDDDDADDRRSLLGRDIIRNWRVTYSHMQRILAAEVLRAGIRVPVSNTPSQPP